MEDKFAKYLQLSNRLIISLLAFIVSLLIILFSIRLVFDLLDSMPWFVYLFTLFIIIVPSAVFICIFLASLYRVKNHPSAPVRLISYVLNGAVFLAWAYFLCRDIITFFLTGSQQIGNYNSYNVLYLAGSVALIFLLAIIQALSTEKEKDWIEKRKERLGN